MAEGAAQARTGTRCAHTHTHTQALVLSLPVGGAGAGCAAPVVAQALADRDPPPRGAGAQHCGRGGATWWRAWAQWCRRWLRPAPAGVGVLWLSCPRSCRRWPRAGGPAAAGGIALLVRRSPRWWSRSCSSSPIPALVDSLGTVIDALVVAIPQLLQVFIDQRPPCWSALAQAVFELVGAVTAWPGWFPRWWPCCPH